MCVCQFIVAITGTASSFSDIAAQKAAIAFVCIYIFFFASSWGKSHSQPKHTTASNLHPQDP